MKAKNILLKTLASSLIALNIFNGLIPSNTITAIAAESDMTSESQDDGTFIPFRSYYVNYLSQHCTEADDEAVYIFCKMMSEQMNGTDNCSAGNWFSTYYSETVLPGGTYLSESEAKKQYIYKNGTSNATYYDQLIANLISANGMKLINAWVNGYTDSYGDVVLSASQGKDSFIKFFDSEYGSWTQTAAAITKLTQTSEGNTWMQNYVYAKNGSSEYSVGITLLKLYCTDFDDINSTQLAWCKGYLPYLLSNYASNGASALAASTKNAYLYDFMARSVNGAQCTLTKASATTVSANGTSLGTVAKGTSLQQEFFNYVVASGIGFGEFCQNIIGGGTYTASTPNRTVSGQSLTKFASPAALFTAADCDADYNASTVGDGDGDWFGHGIWLYANKGSNSQFANIYKLIANNSTTNLLYLDWVKRFVGVNYGSLTWSASQMQDYSFTSENTDSSGKGGHFYIEISGQNRTGGASSKASDGDAISSEFATYAYASVTKYGIENATDKMAYYKVAHSFRKGTFSLQKFDPIELTYNTHISYGAKSVVVSFGSSPYATYQNYSNVKIMVCKPDGTNVNTGECAPFGSTTITIPDSAWKDCTYLVLKFIYNPYDATKYAFNNTNCFDDYSHCYQWLVGSVTENYKSGTNGLEGYTWSSWQKAYSNDYSTCKLYRTVVGNSGIVEAENITATKTETSTAYVYTYNPNTLTSVKPWSVTISKDLGSGTQSLTVNGTSSKSNTTSISAGYYSSGYADITFSHYMVGGTWYASTTAYAEAWGTAATLKGLIKQNAKIINVSINGDATVYLMNKDGSKILMSKTGLRTITMNVSSLSAEDLYNSYLAIYHTNSSSVTNSINGSNVSWDYYPGASVTATSKINSVTVTY